VPPVGAWGTGTFENDDALDFAAQIAGSEDGADLLRRQLELAGVPGTLDAPASEASLVAAEMVAAARGAPDPGMPPALARWVQKEAPALGEDDVRLALAACERVLADSELRELWAEDDAQLAAWTAAVTGLVERLRGVAGEGAAPSTAAGAAVPWKMWEALSPNTTSFVAALYERHPVLAAAAEIRVALISRVKSNNEFDQDLALRVTITPGGDVTVEFAGLEETFPVEAGPDDDRGSGDHAFPTGAPAVRIDAGTLDAFLDDLMADRVCVVHRYVDDDLEYAFAVRIEDIDAAVRAVLAAPAARRLLGRKKRASAVVVSWTGAHDREVGAD
jgi:hypothetical protein